MFNDKKEKIYGPTRKDLNVILKEKIKEKKNELKILKKEFKHSVKLEKRDR